MKYETGSQYCENCGIDREYHALISDTENQIVWFECGHVLIVKDSVIIGGITFRKDE